MALELLNYTRDDLIGVAVSQVLPHGITTALIEQLASGNVLQRMRCLLMDSDEQTLSVFLTTFVAMERKGER